MKRYLLHIAGLMIVLLFLTDCSTQKNTRTTRFYHNFTSRYNVLFNAKESLRETEEKIDKNIENDFTRILPIYKSSDISVPNMIKSDAERVIIKCSKQIELHSITAKPKRRRKRTRKYQEFAKKEEFNKWVDESYLLMGKANYYLQNYNNAITNLNYVIRHFPETNSKYDALVWLIRSYAAQERYTEATEIIKEVQADRNFPRRLSRELAIATADFYMRQKEYANTIKFLNIAIKNTFWKRNKARLQYIIAQLYKELNQPEKSLEAYKAVTKLNPDYKMAFNAKINAASVFSGNGDSKEIRKQLKKMLRDKKNIDFRDQIYFALANLDMKEKKRDEAKENYRKSVATSFQNQFQRAQSSITLANLYFEDLEYKKAQAYYDSAMIIIDEQYPDYKSLETKYKSLSKLVGYLNTVERQDSLQKVAKMPQKEREALIAQLIQQEQKRRQAEQMAGFQGSRNRGYYRANRYRMGMGRNQGGGGGWYFYNPQTVTYGKNQFNQRWGRRKLEDNWRRSNKKEVSLDELDELAEEMEAKEKEKRVEDPLKKEFYTQDLPLTDSLMQISHEKIRDALYNAGRIFKTDFANYNRSAETFIDLNNRYPENIYLLSAYFNLYDLYELLNNKEKSNYYRNLIISQFPDSKYAQYLQNPNFFAELEARKKKLNQYYEELFYQYKQGNYNRILPTTAKIKEMKPDSIILSKVDFLATIAQGNQDGVEQFEKYINQYIATYPKAEPVPLAKQILGLIQDSTLTDYQKLVEIGYINESIQNAEVVEDQGKDEFGGKYSYEGDLLHYFVVAYPVKADIDLNRLKFDIANYNIDYYTKIDFDIETENLNDKIALLIVRVIENKDDALIYHSAIIRKARVFKALKDIEFYNFVISSTNYRQLLTDQSLTEYLKFFIRNYSRHIQSNFSDEDYDISPEELMAKAKEDEELKEKGKYVVVNTSKSIYDASVDTTQNFVLAIKDTKLSTSKLRREFTGFNRDRFKSWQLKTQIEQINDYQLMVVKGIPSLNESMSYFRQVVTTRSLFKSLGRTTYRNFLITDENLNRLIKEGKVDGYIKFFRERYIQQKASSSNASSQKEKTEKSTDNQDTVKEDTASKIYDSNIEGKHKFVFVIPQKGVDKKQFLDNIKNFNNSNYADLKIEIKESSLDNIRQLITLSGFDDKESAMRYFKTIVQNRDLYKPLGKASYRNFLISDKNYKTFLQDKNIKSYINFYKQTYL